MWIEGLQMLIPFRREPFAQKNCHKLITIQVSKSESDSDGLDAFTLYSVINDQQLF